MKALLYHKHVFALNEMGEKPSEVVDGGEPSVREDVIFHNVKVFNHFFAKGR